MVLYKEIICKTDFKTILFSMHIQYKRVISVFEKMFPVDMSIINLPGSAYRLDNHVDHKAESRNPSVP